ncbi:alanine racemase [Microbacterium sp. A196]|uniref:alanine racemase n=1 Tax=Microbacterium sp. A196 TaxID=3457320 RepID=UPI003FD1EA7D
MREAIIDTSAIIANVRHLMQIAGTAEFIAVVKADGYGHGALRAARAAVAGGATRIGTADLGEALALAGHGLEVPLLAWLHPPGRSFEDAAAASIEIGISSHQQMEASASAATGRRPTGIHLKLETGLGRGGAAPAEWPALFARAKQLENTGLVRVLGLFSHLSGTSPDDDLEQVRVFQQGIDLAHLAGLDPPLLHIAATAATISLPEARFNAVRVGLGIYGLSPFAGTPSVELDLYPAMTLRAPVSAVRRVPAGQGVSYGYDYRTTRATTLALVPLGYADGIFRHASGRVPVLVGGRRYRVAGRIAMDQFVIDVGDDPVDVGDPVTIFGDPASGAPSVAEWADAAGTINYEIVTRVGARVCRRAV